MAKSLVELLPILVKPASWKTDSTHEKIIKLIEQLKGNKNSYSSSKHGGLVPNGGMGGGIGGMGMGGFGGGMM